MIGSDNKALVRRYFEELANQGNLAVAVEILTPEAVEIMQQFIVMLRTAFPDFTSTIHDQIAEGDKVATRFTARGTHLGAWQSPMGKIAPTGKQFEHEGIRIFRIADGKLVDTWGGADTVRQLQQLGILPINDEDVIR
jgi:predicted ester cyclase